MKMQVLVLNNKHDTQVIEVPPGELSNVMLQVVRARIADGWYGHLHGEQLEWLKMITKGHADAAKAARRLFNDPNLFEGDWVLCAVEPPPSEVPLPEVAPKEPDPVRTVWGREAMLQNEMALLKRDREKKT